MQQRAPLGEQAESAASDVTFGFLLRSLREAAGLTQEELAERAGLTSHAVSSLERGARSRPYPHTVRSLATALELDDAGRAELLAAVPRRRSPSVASDGPSPQTAPKPAPLPGQRSASPERSTGGVVVPGTELHGRAEDIDAVAALVRHEQRRLVTLTGLGGVGKTRLAAAVADRLRPDYPDGAVLVGLAHLDDPARVLPEIAGAVGMVGVDGPEGTSRLVEFLAPLRMVLVLDNLEQVLAAAEDVADLVAAAPGITVLATSRAPLRVRSEIEYPVAPLATPQGDTDSIEALSQFPAGAMFLERARAAAPDMVLSPSDALSVAALCRRLSGIPLALELAAAHLRFLEPDALLARLDDVMSRPGPRDLPGRQRTMQAALEWSRELLSDDEQRLLRLFSVFQGGCTLDAVETVCSSVGGVELDVLDALSGLVEHSLVVVVGDGVHGRRYGMLEPVAQYAAGLLVEADLIDVRRRHAHYYFELAEQAAPAYTGSQQIEWLARLEREDANISATLAFCLVDGDADSAAHLGWALWLYWWLRGRLLYGRQTMEAALRADLTATARAHALLTFGAMTFAEGDLQASAPAWLEAFDLGEAIDDPEVRVAGCAGIGLVALAGGDLDLAERQFVRTLELVPSAGWAGRWTGTLTEIWLGTVRLVRGDVERAVAHLHNGLAAARERGDRLTAYVALFNLSQAAIAGGESGQARAHLEEGARLSAETGDAANLAYVLESLAVLEAADGRFEAVAVLIGAAEAMRVMAGGSVYGYYLPDLAQRDAAAGAAASDLGPDAYERHVRCGRAMGFDEAVRYVLSDDPT